MENSSNPLVDKTKSDYTALESQLAEKSVQIERNILELARYAALERIRTRTLSMKDSSELAEVVSLFFQEFTGLNVMPPSTRTYFSKYNLNENIAEIYITQADGTIRPGSHITPSNAPNVEDVVKAYQNKESFYIRNYTGETLEKYFTFMSKLPHVIADEGYQKMMQSAPKELNFIDAFYSLGTIGIMTTSALTQELLDTIVAFAKAFDLPFTRFQDLKRNEELVEKAHSDYQLLIEEKKRTEEAFTELKMIQAQLVAQKERAEASEAFKSRFLAKMSHEIRSPLHGVAGFTDMMFETALTEKQRHYIASIQHSTDRLSEVVNDILDISKLEAGEVKLRQIPFLIKRIASDVQDALSIRAENKCIDLVVKIADNVPEAVVGDPTRLYQILINLVGNAVKFTEKGQVQLEIETQPSTEIRNPKPEIKHLLRILSLKFSILDTGIGIPSEKLSEIFKSFQQANEDTTARFGGTGLGLTIARELVQLHGSDIHVESTLGKGSRFSFMLNLLEANVAEIETKMEMGDDFYFKHPLSILLADDIELNREIATEAISRNFENAHIVEATNGKEVLNLLKTTHFDLILMDMQMPEMTGTEAARYIRSHFKGKKCTIPIIALTASATPDEVEKALASGMNRHLSKPFKPDALAQVIAETLGLASDLPHLKNQNSRIEMNLEGRYDLTFMRDFCDGDEKQMQHFIQKFQAQCPLEIKRLETAFKKQDRESIYQAAHSFKPQLEFVGLKEANSVVAIIEKGARAGQSFVELAKLMHQLKKLLLF